MLNHPSENWSFCIGRWRGVEVRLHIALPLLMLAVLRLQGIQHWVSLTALLVLMVSVAIHELVRVIAATRVGGYVHAINLGPIGGMTKLHLPADPPAHLIAGMVGPLTFFVLMLAAGCGLAFAGDSRVPQILLHPNSPPIDMMTITTTTLYKVGQLVVWINWCLLLVSLLPIDPCAGAEIIRGILWPVVGRSTANTVTSHIALGSALFSALLALVMFQQVPSLGYVPSWLPFAVGSVFLFFGASRSAHMKRYDVGLPFDEFDSDDEEWLAQEWGEDDREAVLVEHPQDKQQEVIDRKRREREANEDARVDAILARLRDSSFDQLSEEERTILKRASRRYRQRRDQTHGDR